MTIPTASTGTCMAFSASAPATLDVAGFAAIDNWVEWGDITNYGKLGVTASIQNYTPVCDGVERKIPTKKTPNDMALEAMHVETDAAQIIIEAAIDATPISIISCRVVLSTGAIRYFQGYPGSFEEDIGDADSLFMAQVNLVRAGLTYKVAAPA